MVSIQTERIFVEKWLFVWQNEGLVQAFETTLILRRLLESRNETIREKSFWMCLCFGLLLWLAFYVKSRQCRFTSTTICIVRRRLLSSNVKERNETLLAALPSDEQIEIYEQSF